MMSKAGSEVILKCLMGKEKDIDIDTLPFGPEDEKRIETVVEAETVRPARGRIVEEVLIKREFAEPQMVVIDNFGGEAEVNVLNHGAVQVKEEIVE